MNAKSLSIFFYFAIQFSHFWSGPYGTPEGTFLFQYLPEKKSKEKELERKSNNNITFKPLLIFPFQYIAEKKLKQEYWKGNQNKNISFYRFKISFLQHNAGLQLVDFSPMGGQEYFDISRYYVDKSRFLS